MTTYKLKPKEVDLLDEVYYRQAYKGAYLKGIDTVLATDHKGRDYVTRRNRPLTAYDKKRGAIHAGITTLAKHDSEGPGLGSPQSESYNYDEAFQVYKSEEEGFNSPKEAVKWCNKMYQLTNDNRYKQISNYLHIYL